MLAKRDHFERLYAKWLRARAADDDPKQDGSDEAGDKHADLVNEATLEFGTAPAVFPWMVWCKWEVLELDIAEDLRNGQRADNRVIIIPGRHQGRPYTASHRRRARWGVANGLKVAESATYHDGRRHPLVAVSLCRRPKASVNQIAAR